MTSDKLGLYPVLIVWEDAAHQFGWLDGEEVEAQDTVVETVGWLASQTDEYVIVMQSITEGGHAQTLQIPAGMVRSVQKLELV